MLKLLLCPDWTVGRDAILQRMGADVRACRGNRILMVPELISHDTERRLCIAAGDTASRYAEVLSFTRLGRRVADTMGSASQACLDEGGRVVAMASVARQLAGQLKAYASLEAKPEFLAELVNAVDEFKRCCISPADLAAAALATEGSLAQKLQELSLLMEGYDALCSRGKRDPRDQMTWLLEQLEQGDFGREHVFYIDGFPDFTRQHMEILAHLIRVSPQVTISLTCDKPDSGLLAFETAGATAGELLRQARRDGVTVEVECLPGRQDALAVVREKLFQGSIDKGCAAGCLGVYQAEDPYQECMAAAWQVRQLVSRGCRYRDITLACTDMAVYEPLAELIFHRLHIPLYRSGTEDILQKSVIATVLTALDAALSDFGQREMLQYLRSALSPLSPEECDLVENYAIVWGIRGAKWLAEWENHPDGLNGIWDDRTTGLLEDLNRWRRTAVEPLENLRRGFRSSTCLKEQVLALYDFLQDIRLAQRLADLAEEYDRAGDGRNAQILNQLWEILLSALEQLYDVLGDTHWDSDHFTRLLKLLLSRYNVGTIPPVLDAVQMGPVSAMRCHQEKHLILLGAEEGCLPGYGGTTGVLTDQERVALRKLGVPLTGGNLQGIQAEFSEIYGLFSGAEEGIQVYSSGQPSFVCRRLAELAGNQQQADTALGFAGADRQEAGLYLARWDSEDAAGKLGLQTEYHQGQLRRDYGLGRVSGEHIRGLYGRKLELSASRIDCQADCRLAHFLKYGLRASPRKEATVDPAEFGTYVHDVLENTAREVMEQGGFHQVSLEDTLAIAHRHSESYTQAHFSKIESERLTYLFRRNLRELDMVVAELWQELSRSEFQPVGFEVSFGGKKGQLPPIAVPNNAMAAVIRGFIDRVDLWQSPGSPYFRVVDYKTGQKSFDYCDVFNGVGLQMLVYLFALRSSGSDMLGFAPVAAGVQYFPARVPYLSADGRLTAEEAEQERQKIWRRKGLLLDDEAVLSAMEPGENPSRCFQRKDGAPRGEFADREQLKALETYLFRVLASLVEDIAAGNVEPNPYTRGMEHDPCRFCDFSPVCHGQIIPGRRNYKKMEADQFWDAIEKELKEHG